MTQLPETHIGTTTGTVSNLGNLTWGNTGTIATTSAGWGYGFDNRSEYFKCIFEYLNENEISEIVSKLISRGAEEKHIKGTLKYVLENRHCSEDFLMNFIDYFDLGDLKTRYSSQIKSQEYPRLALLVQAN